MRNASDKNEAFSEGGVLNFITGQSPFAFLDKPERATADRSQITRT